ncbi:MAG: radical SAM protein [Verrucomicrobia bacterium]|nr:radical SAM protein [Verrucomicrobiota bacterium]
MMISALTHDFGKKLRFANSFLRGRLVHVNLQLLYDCNFHCRICDFWSVAYRGRPRLSVAEVAVISEKLNQIGPQIVSIGGGEPMLHPDLAAIVRALARHHFPVMITNGSRVTAEFAHALWQAGMVEISVSVDYATAEEHDAQRGVAGAYAQALTALRVLHETRTHPEQRVNMISVIMDDNLAEVEPLIRLCREMGITYLVTLYSRSRGSKPERAASEGMSRRLLSLKKQYRHFVALRGYLERFSEATARGGVGNCSAGRNLWNIDSQGNVTFCIDQLGEPAGNLLTDDVLVIERRMRKRQRANTCRDCWTSCRGSIEALRDGL